MKQIRKHVFETNSSSTHSLVMAVASDFDRWVKGEVYYCDCFPSWRADGALKKFEKTDSRFYTAEEVDAICKAGGISTTKDKYGYSDRQEYFVTYDEFTDTDSLEVDTYSYTLPSGEVVKAVAKYGYDG